MKLLDLRKENVDLAGLKRWAASTTKDSFSPLQKYPIQALFRSPYIHKECYRTLGKNYRFGKITLPSTDDGTWPDVVDRLVGWLREHRLVRPEIEIVSVAVLLYDVREKPHLHKDPSAYSFIGSLTLEGTARMVLVYGRDRREVPIETGSLLLLDDLEDTHVAKHGVLCEGDIQRLNIVIRGVQKEELVACGVSKKRL